MEEVRRERAELRAGSQQYIKDIMSLPEAQQVAAAPLARRTGNNLCEVRAVLPSCSQTTKQAECEKVETPLSRKGERNFMKRHAGQSLSEPRLPDVCVATNKALQTIEKLNLGKASDFTTEERRMCRAYAVMGIGEKRALKDIFAAPVVTISGCFTARHMYLSRVERNRLAHAENGNTMERVTDSALREVLQSREPRPAAARQQKRWQNFCGAFSQAMQACVDEQRTCAERGSVRVRERVGGSIALLL